MALVGYARSSDASQFNSLEAQVGELTAAGCHTIYQEHAGANADREQFDAALAYARTGDSLVVVRLDRLQRDTVKMLAMIDELAARDIGLRVLEIADGDINPASPTMRMFFTLMTGYSQFERDMMRVRQAPGIAKAKAEGRYLGRAPTARAKTDEVMLLHRSGIGATEIAKMVGVSRASVYRIVATSTGEDQ